MLGFSGGDGLFKGSEFSLRIRELLYLRSGN